MQLELQHVIEHEGLEWSMVLFLCIHEQRVGVYIDSLQYVTLSSQQWHIYLYTISYSLGNVATRVVQTYTHECPNHGQVHLYYCHEDGP